MSLELDPILGHDARAPLDPGALSRQGEPAQPARRRFIVSSAAGAGGLALAFHVPFAPVARAQAPVGPEEINAWVLIKPDETVVIRIARSEMGQGTLTGLAQLVAEELECDWSRVTTEYPTPGQNVARNRVWGNYSTGGSRGVRESNEYVRKGGAAARLMLVQAAADEWKVPASECTVSRGVVTHKGSGFPLQRYAVQLRLLLHDRSLDRR